jgi:uncharacterized membrane protein
MERQLSNVRVMKLLGGKVINLNLFFLFFFILLVELDNVVRSKTALIIVNMTVSVVAIAVIAVAAKYNAVVAGVKSF